MKPKDKAHEFSISSTDMDCVQDVKPDHQHKGTLDAVEGILRVTDAYSHYVDTGREVKHAAWKVVHCTAAVASSWEAGQACNCCMLQLCSVQQTHTHAS